MENREFHDRLIDSLLKELIGGETPPDLKQRILDRADAGEMPFDFSKLAPARRSWARWVAPLAAAALVMASVGGFFMLNRFGPRLDFPANDPFARITKRVGQVQVDGNSITTGPGSYCRLDLKDGSVVASDENTAVDLSRNKTTGGLALEHKKGRAYVDLARQKSPLIASCGDSRIEVTGTRFLTGLSQGVFGVAVLDGEVNYLHEGRSANVTKGQIAAYRDNAIAVTSTPLPQDAVEWVGQLDLDAKALLADFEAAGLRQPVQGIPDSGTYRVLSGRWELGREDGGVTIRQTDPYSTDAMIIFGRPGWAKGVMAAKFRVTAIKGALPSVSVTLWEGDHSDSFGLRRQLPDLVKSGGWVELRVPFEVLPGDRMIVDQMSAWPEDASEKRVLYRFEKNPANSLPGRKRVACSIGVMTENCSVEFRDLRLEDGVPAGEAKPLVFYKFNEGKGNIVRDISGAGEPLDLTIQKPECVRWVANGLEINGSALLTSKTASKLAAAWRECGGLTIEFWGTTDRRTIPNQRYCTTKMVWRDGSSFVHSMHGVVPGGTGFYVVTFTRKGDGFVMGTFIEAGKFLSDKSFDAPIGKMVADSPFSLQIAPNDDQKAHPSVRSWMGKVYSVKVYKGALSVEEIKRHYEQERAGILDAAFVRRYVDGEVILQDDFEKGLDNWETVSAGDEFWRFGVRSPRFESAKDSRDVCIEQVKRRDGMSNALMIDGTKGLRGVRMRKSLTGLSFSVEYDLYQFAPPRGAKSSSFNTSFMDMTHVVKWTTVKPQSDVKFEDKWEHWRVEYVVSEQHLDTTSLYMKRYKDGELHSEAQLECQEVAAMPWASEAKACIDNVKIRELIWDEPGSTTASVLNTDKKN